MNSSILLKYKYIYKYINSQINTFLILLILDTLVYNFIQIKTI